MAEEEEHGHRAWVQADTSAMRRALLSLIHRFYLDALSRLPAADLRTALARGLLAAGHCYGPLHPVHNILLNSIWYAAASPLRAAVDVISGDGLVRVCLRSLDGLVAFLRRFCPSLSTGDALWHLLSADADLSVAVALANRTIKSSARAAMRPQAHGAFQAAAEAARHPDPAALGLFMASVLPAVEHDIASLLRGRTWRSVKCFLAKISCYLHQWKVLCTDAQAVLLQRCILLLDKRRGELLRIAWT